jgi:hypothetical protein
LLAAACSTTQPVSAGEPVEIEWDILPEIASGQYVSGRFVEVTRAAYPSAVADRTLRVWITTEDAAEFARVAPDVEGSGAELERGAIIVREVLLPDGAIESLTVMARSQPGYSPTCGDYWFGALDAEGWPLPDDVGEPLIGPLVDDCAGCHIGRVADGFLFGVPDIHRVPADAVME